MISTDFINELLVKIVFFLLKSPNFKDIFIPILNIGIIFYIFKKGEDNRKFEQIRNQAFQEKISEINNDINKNSNRPIFYFKPFEVSYELPVNYNKILLSSWKSKDNCEKILSDIPKLKFENVGKGNARNCLIAIHSVNAIEYFSVKDSLVINQEQVSKYEILDFDGDPYLNVINKNGNYNVKLYDNDSTPIRWMRLIPSNSFKEIEISESDLVVFNDFIFNEKSNKYIPYIMVNIVHFDDYNEKDMATIYIVISEISLKYEEDKIKVSFKLEEKDITEIKGFNSLDKNSKYFNN